jgi:hypothetical protein
MLCRQNNIEIWLMFKPSNGIPVRSKWQQIFIAFTTKMIFKCYGIHIFTNFNDAHNFATHYREVALNLLPS